MDRRTDWEEMLPSLRGEERCAMEFLREHLPQSDLDGYSAELFLNFARHAAALRKTAPWCGELDWSVFAHYVLFPRVNDEDLSCHRELFYEALWPRVKDLPDSEARVQEVNRWCRECVVYQAQDERTASPLTVYRCGSGRCGEESAFLVSALRSVGIAARQVYVPRWSHCDDNHAWVEVLCDRRWRYLGACEPEPELDRGWFTTAASRAVLVHSRIFGGAEDLPVEQVLGTAGGVTWLNQTARYAEGQIRTFRAEIEGRPAAGAQFHLQILNEAVYRTIAVLTADERGEAQVFLGLGSVHVAARLGELWAEGECGAGSIVLNLKTPAEDETPWIPFDFHAPADSHPAPAALSPEIKRQRLEVRQQADEVRQARLGERCQGAGQKEWEDLRQKALGNWVQLRAFLKGPESAQRERLVRTLSDKDLRDVTIDVLEDHFTHLPAVRPDVPEDIYWTYVARPRVALERLTPWRGVLKDWLMGRTADPVHLWKELGARVGTDGAGSYYRLWQTPEAALYSGAYDEKSRELLWAAALRTLGIPARLRPLDGAPEYWAEGSFRAVIPEKTGTLRLTRPEGVPLMPGRSWSLSRWTKEGWRRLNPTENQAYNEWTLTLAPGRYRVITTVRLPGGDQLAARRELVLQAGEERTLALWLRPWTAKNLLTCQPLPVLPARLPDGEQVADLFRMGTGPALILWLEEGTEPTEHVLNELLARQGSLDLPVLFLLRGMDSMSQPTLARAVEQLPVTCVLPDDWAYDMELTARQLGREPDDLPLMVLCDGVGRARYSASGYRVGAVELLLRAACIFERDRARLS